MVKSLYITIKELADQLKLSEKETLALIKRGNLNTVSDGEQLLVNKVNFDDYMELLRHKIEEFNEKNSEPIPEDYDVKDED